MSQHVTAEETRHWHDQVGRLLADLRPGFKILVDWSSLDSMDLDCAPEIGLGMEALGRAGVSKVVRIVPDPRKDIGINIISLFHSPRGVSFVTCDTMEEALQALGD